MIPTLSEMVSLHLLTPNEATELNAYVTADPQTWLTAPPHLLQKAWAAWQILEFDPEQIPHLTMH